jgi:chromosome segregation ATPase
VSDELSTATRIAALEDHVVRLLAENVRLTNEAGEMRAALDASQAREAAYRADVVRLTEQLEYQTLLANARKETIGETTRAWDRERSRAEVLAAEVRTKRALLEDADRERMAWAKIVNDDKAEEHTDSTNALDPAKFERKP